MFRRPHLVVFVLAGLLAGCAAPPAVQVEGPAGPVEAPRLIGGERWTYEESDGYTGRLLRRVIDTLERDGSGFALVRRGEAGGASERSLIDVPWQVRDELAGDRRRIFAHGAPELAFPLIAGTHSRFDVPWRDMHGNPSGLRAEFQVIGWERIRVPAGEFTALRVERTAWLGDWFFGRSQTMRRDRYWYAPEVGRWVRHERFDEWFERGGRVARRFTDWTVWQLAAWQRPG